MYVLKGQKYAEDPDSKLGGGSEGSVYSFEGDPTQCVKLFHEPEPGDQDARRLAKYRANKIKAICGLNLNLPKQFVTPVDPVYDLGGQVSGFMMRRVPIGFHKLKKLTESSFRISQGITLAYILKLYALLFEDLSVLHAHKHKLVVGDVNLGGVLFTETLRRAWVDMDSLSYPDYPCIATTERFAHPDLYPNLTPGAGFVQPQPHHDRFAFAVQVVLMTLRVHPFNAGTHPSVVGLQNRAMQHITVFDPGVKYPASLPKPELLSDDLLDRLIQVLKQTTTDPIPPDLLRETAEGLVVCSSCKTEYHRSRTACPQCSQKTMVDIKMVAELVIAELGKIPGVLLFTQVVDGVLKAVCNVQGQLRILNVDSAGRISDVSTGLKVALGARYRFFGPCLAICPNPYQEGQAEIHIYRIDGKTVTRLDDSSTEVLENEVAVFDASERFLYRIAGNSLMCGSLFSNGKFLIESRISQVYRNQSWFTVDRTSGTDHEIIFGYDRALRDLQWFLVRGDKDGTNFNYHDIGVLKMRSGEKLEDHAVYFNSVSVLLVRRTGYRGKDFVRYTIIRHNGTIAADEVLGREDSGFEHWDHMHGKLFQGGSILHATSNGMVKQTVPGNTYALLPDTKGFITADDRFFRFGGAIGVARQGSILTIARKTK
jgi:hypothetical protein